VTDCKSARAVP